MGIAYNTSIVRDGLVLQLDAANVKSYPGTGTVWNDLSGNGANCNLVGAPGYVQSGAQSHWQFGAGDGFESVNINQSYVDLMMLMQLETTSPTFSMAFSQYNDVDRSLRFTNGDLRTVALSNSNDWQFGSAEAELFVNGNFNAGGTDISNRWTMIRAFSAFSTPFRYEVSSQFAPGAVARPYLGKIAAIMSYNRKLTNDEVKQNFEALRGRYGI
jgi:hypothetical protein